MRFLFVSSPIYSLIYTLIANRSSISQQLHFNFCYFYFGILSSLILPFMSHFDQLRFYPCSSTTFRVHKFIISYITFENTTMALGAHMYPYSYMYCTSSRDGRYMEYACVRKSVMAQDIGMTCKHLCRNVYVFTQRVYEC